VASAPVPAVDGIANTGSGYTSLGSAQVRRFDVTRFTDPQAMTPGNIPNIYPWIRNPGRSAYDASLMKNFGIIDLTRTGKIALSRKG